MSRGDRREALLARVSLAFRLPSHTISVLRAHVLLAKPCHALFAEGSCQGHFFGFAFFTAPFFAPV
jgi:hypothetical protein